MKITRKFVYASLNTNELIQNHLSLTNMLNLRKVEVSYSDKGC